jgi:hypothetical protein
MMKIKFILLSGLLIVLGGCGNPRLTLIPEINPPLIQEDVFLPGGPVAGDALFPCSEGIGWVETSGQIVTWNVEKRIAGRVIRLPFAVSDPPFRQGDFLVLKSQDDNQLLVFDLTRMKTSFELRDLPVRQILAVDADCLIYLDGENLVVYSWQKPAGIFRCPSAENEFFNCQFFSDRVLMLSRRHWFTFWKADGKFQVLTLPVEAATEFLCQGEYIYFGTRQRQLVKFSLRKNKVIWKLKLGHNLERRPLALAGGVVISPADNNVLQLNGHGSVRWWLALDSIARFNLVPMTDHLAAFLMNREIKFINLRRQQVTAFKMEGRPDSLPLAVNHDLYFFMTAKKMQKLQRVGNQYGIDVALTPETVHLPGAPVTFSILTSNLLKPTLACVIRDAAGQTVLTKNFTPADRASLVWIPTRTGSYRMQVSAKALNRHEEKEISFQVLDAQEIIPNWHFHF